MIELVHVSKAHGARMILQDFNLTVNRGERLVLYGPSGSGKTTILRLIAGFLAPDQGTISLDSQIASREGHILLAPERRALGYVFQDLALWPHMTVHENIAFPLKSRGVSRRERSDRVREMLSLVQLESFGNTYPASLSGGEQQRVAIARALIAQPRAVLMDEPLSNLDDELKVSLCDRILDLHKRFGFTLVYVTHDRDEISRLDGRTLDLRHSIPKLNTEG